MSTRKDKTHSDWLGFVQQEGLVVSPMILSEKECYVRQPFTEQQRFRSITEEHGLQSTSDLSRFLKWHPKSLRDPTHGEKKGLTSSYPYP